MDGLRTAAVRIVVCLAGGVIAAEPVAVRALDRTQLAVIVNTADPLSVQIGEYYAAQRSIIFQNIIKVQFPPGGTTLTSQEFGPIKASVDEQSVPRVQAYALTWAAPYRVECMSVTSAFAFGFDPAFCARGCKPTRRSPYFDSPAKLPFTQLKIRPTMAIAAASLQQAMALIDRGTASDGSFPAGTAYLVSTSDSARNTRTASYEFAKRIVKDRVRVRVVAGEAIMNADDVLFYFTGRARVEGLETLRFMPGAIADHLTSTAGMLTDSQQMSALRWLEAGATGSYGAVVEPCNLAEKFPDPAVVAAHYLKGETLIEAYWKSVAMPGQGIFVGEPLAVPFRRQSAAR